MRVPRLWTKLLGLIREALDTDERGVFVEVFGKKGHESKVSIGVDNHGDCVAVRGCKRNGEAVFGSIQYRNSAVSTWGYQGNRQ